LEERRIRRTLQLLYNNQKGSTPSYLLDLIPPTILSTTIYPLRNGNDIIVPFCRLPLTRDSFVSATVREWNTLPFVSRFTSILMLEGSQLRLLNNISLLSVYLSQSKKKW
jgi:hypothetical protein